MVFKRFGAICAALVLAAASLLGMATVASAAIVTTFDLNGAYAVGSSAHPVISNNNDQLTIDMSQFRRPTARGLVLNRNTIVVSFPDDATFTGLLLEPDLILWSNGSGWNKARVVPNVQGLSRGAAASTIAGAGLVLGSVGFAPDPDCEFIGTVFRQNPAAGRAANPGSAVNLTIGTQPPICR